MFTIYNTANHRKEVFKPVHDGEVRFYGCGPTVYNYAHIGNMRAFVFYDLLNRYLRYKGYKVTFCMNLTDVDDKTIRDSQKAGKKLRDFTDFYAAEFFKDCATLHIQKPDITPRATEEIPAMIDLIQNLLDKGYAYQTEKGDIYFKISAFKNYGQMAGIDASSLRTNADGRLSADEYEKENAQDFALWKAWDEKDGDNYWETPFGKGRPGWHIECSAMSRKYLGQPFDIHTGGIDLVFPHHTNEIAQSECAYGTEFVRYWMHNEHITVNGKKMSKSLGNCFTVNELLNKGYSPEAIRYEFIKAHYRQNMDFQEQSLAGNQSVIDKFGNFLSRLKYEAKGAGWSDLPDAIKRALTNFEAGMDDDLNTSMALAALFDFMTDVNKNFDLISSENASEIISIMKKFDSVLAVFPAEKVQKLTSEQQFLIDQRQVARQNKDWATADALKKQLLDQGIEIKDTSQGPVWRFL
ncbi:MAG: cysteine--tRNA ligase [Alphaproteobacteria bacterium]|nr:cysteine--tRNA ligase [Alphaproteobacteria bacterium]